MTKVKDVYDYLCRKAPLALQMDFDNSGFQLGRLEAPAERVLLALDVTDAVVDEAIRERATLIISHHPLLFHPLRNVLADDLTGRKVLTLARHGISAICMHTNLDIADGGVNDTLMHTLKAEITGLLEPAGTDDDGNPLGCGRIGYLTEAMPLNAFLRFITERLHVSGLRYCDSGKQVHKIAVCGGSGGSTLELAYGAGCDTFVTADIKYDRFLAAKELGMNLIDADHFCTENVVVPVIAQAIQDAFPDLEVMISRALQQTTQFYMP